MIGLDAMIERFIDYLQYSIFYREQTCREQGHKEISGHGFYSRGYTDGLGVRRYFGNPNSKKALVVMSGRALQNHRAVKWDTVETIEKVLSQGAKITRLDIAITEYTDNELQTIDDCIRQILLPDFVQLDEIENSIANNRIVSNWANYGSKKIVCIDKEYENPTETIYLGSMDERGKKGIFRAYDKGLELGLGKYLGTRIEAEDRGDKAHVSAKRLAKGNSLSSVFRTRFDCNDEWFNRLCDDTIADMTRGEKLAENNEHESMEKKWVWLMKQVAPALRKMNEYDKREIGNNDRLMLFLQSAGIIN